MPKNDLNVTLKGIDELLFSTEEQRQEEKESKCSRFPLMNCIRSPTILSKLWTMKP